MGATLLQRQLSGGGGVVSGGGGARKVLPPPRVDPWTLSRGRQLLFTRLVENPGSSSRALWFLSHPEEDRFYLRHRTAVYPNSVIVAWVLPDCTVGPKASTAPPFRQVFVCLQASSYGIRKTDEEMV